MPLKPAASPEDAARNRRTRCARKRRRDGAKAAPATAAEPAAAEGAPASRFETRRAARAPSRPRRAVRGDDGDGAAGVGEEASPDVPAMRAWSRSTSASEGRLAERRPTAAADQRCGTSRQASRGRPMPPELRATSSSRGTSELRVRRRRDVSLGRLKRVRPRNASARVAEVAALFEAAGRRRRAPAHLDGRRRHRGDAGVEPKRRSAIDHEAQTKAAPCSEAARPTPSPSDVQQASAHSCRIAARSGRRGEVEDGA